MKKILLIVLLLFGGRVYIQAQTDTSLKVLIVVAHPDDESGFCATVYKITHDLHGKVDFALITNGEGGYKYSTLAEAYYGEELTDPKIGRQYLPSIRKQELMNAGKILGIRNYFFLDQKDDKYGLNEKDPLDTVWDVELIKHRLTQIMTNTKYDYIFCLLPIPQTHAHHKAATILALDVVKTLPESQRPIVLGVTDANKNDTSKITFSELNGYPETKINPNAPIFTFDRSVHFGYKNALTYKIIAFWEIAEHKSQGTMFSGNIPDYENFWYFDENDPKGISKTQSLFNRLKIIPYPVKTY
jgi:N-acetylglucosamine malate deacetylase 2